jgi:MoxR-like ATPase
VLTFKTKVLISNSGLKVPHILSNTTVNYTTTTELQEDINVFRSNFQTISEEISRVIVGQADTINKLLVAIFAGGHILLEGVPGLGKTLLIKSVAKVLGLEFRRIQFTPDLMPSDITGTQVLLQNSVGR